VSCSARRSSATICGSVSAARTYTLVRESSGAITSKEGFSVVAPISTMLPDST
jgi:hypothetical protein